MGVAKMHDQLDGKALNVMALPSPDGWRYYAEIVDRRPAAALHVRSVGPEAFPSAVSALAQGMAYARCIACEAPAGADVWAEVRIH